MGLCKCPKRQMTNQFCFEHRVNVCEHCMVQSHSNCVVQSYLQWLKDSDYISNCSLCSKDLNQDECVRLVCYHVFHWHCLNERQSRLPATTAPHGHQCPTCKTEIFPTSNLVSPVADNLKKKLISTEWGREHGLYDSSIMDTTSLLSNKNSNNETGLTSDSSTMTKIHNANMERPKENGTFMHTMKQNDRPHSVLLMDTFNSPLCDDFHANSRRPLLPRQSPIGGTDRDENKYARRTPAEIFSRWSRRFYTPSSRPPWRRTWFLIFSGILSFIVFIYLMAAFGRSSDSRNTMDDVWNNPNPQPIKNLHYD